MFSNVEPVIKYIECQCSSPDHVVRISHWKFTEDNDLVIEVQFNNHLNWYGRLKIALKYLFKKRYSTWSDCLVEPKQVDDIITLLNNFKSSSQKA